MRYRVFALIFDKGNISRHGSGPFRHKPPDINECHRHCREYVQYVKNVGQGTGEHCVYDFYHTALTLQAYKGLAKAAGGSRNNQEALYYVNAALKIPGLSDRNHRDLNHMKLDCQRYLSRRSQRAKVRNNGGQALQRKGDNHKPNNKQEDDGWQVV